MRKALIPAFLLVVAAIVLGATVFREQIARAATTPFQQVVVQNTSTCTRPVATAVARGSAGGAGQPEGGYQIRRQTLARVAQPKIRCT